MRREKWIDIQTDAGPASVMAFVRGAWAWHRGFGRANSSWSVTHVPSGCRVTNTPLSYAEAAFLATRLSERCAGRAWSKCIRDDMNMRACLESQVAEALVGWRGCDVEV